MSNVVRSAAVRLTMENASYIRGANQSATVTEQATGRIQRSVRQTAASTGRDWEVMGKYGGRAALVIGGGLAYAEKRIVSFDKTMSAAGAATEATAKQQEKLRAAAIKAGADTAFTSSEAAQAIAEEGKAGISTANILSGGLRGALDLAAAGNIGVAEAAEDTATALVQFHLRGDQARHVADLLASSANKAQGEVGDMSLALSYIGVPAHAAKISLEQTIGTIALLAKNGLIGEKAGTSLRGMLASLQSPSKIAQKVMKDLGIEVFDSTGKFKGFDGVAQVLHDRLGGLTDQERQYALGKIFGNEQLQAANILYESGARGVHKMTREVNDQGYATKVANEKLDNLAGDWERFTGSLESAFIKAGTPAQQALRQIVEGGENAVNAFAELPDEIQAGIVKLAVLAAAVGGIYYTISKVRNVARDLRGVGRGRGAAGGLGGAASLAAPVPVYVTNLGAGGLGGGTVLGGGGTGKTGKGGKTPVALGTGADVAAAAITIGTLNETLSVRDSLGRTNTTKNAIVDAPTVAAVRKALESSNVGKYASDLNINLDKLARDLAAHGSSGSYAKRIHDMLNKGSVGDFLNTEAGTILPFWTTKGEKKDRAETDLYRVLKKVDAALKGYDPKKQQQELLYLLSGGKRGKLDRDDPFAKAKPQKDPLDTLLNPNRKGGKKPKEKTSQDVLADIYGINPKKLKPVNLLDEITGLADGVWTGKGKAAKNPIKQFEASLGLDTKGFDKKATHARRTAAELDALHPKVVVDADTRKALTKLQNLINQDWSTVVNVLPFVHNTTGGGAVHPATGGLITGPGTGTSDSIPAYVSNGEYVMRAAAVRKYGVHMFDRLNAERFAGGGAVGGAQYTTGTGLTVLFPTPAQLAAAVKAAEDIALATARAARSQADIRQDNLDTLHTQQQIRDLTKALHERNKKGRLELRGLDRKVARAELADLKASIKEARDEARRAAAEELASKRQDATDQLTQAGDVFARGTSPASAIASVDRAVADISTYGQVMAQLKNAKASPGAAAAADQPRQPGRLPFRDPAREGAARPAGHVGAAERLPGGAGVGVLGGGSDDD